MTRPRFGLSCAIATPYAADGSIDTRRLITHAKACLTEGCGSVTLFGTTGEGFSIGPAERAGVYSALTAAGLDPRYRHYMEQEIAASPANIDAILRYYFKDAAAEPLAAALEEKRDSAKEVSDRLAAFGDRFGATELEIGRAHV